MSLYICRPFRAISLLQQLFAAGLYPALKYLALSGLNTDCSAISKEKDWEYWKSNDYLTHIKTRT
jgi:hypothetical protein